MEPEASVEPEHTRPPDDISNGIERTGRFDEMLASLLSY
jgi:hypothetical protein